MEFKTAQEKSESFMNELNTLLKKYNASISLEQYGSAYMKSERMIVEFEFDNKLAELTITNSGCIPDIILGSYVG